MIPPALKDASTDARLQGADMRMLVYLAGLLDPGEYRTLKLWPIARELHMNKATASKAIRRLVDCGYLREGLRQEDGKRAYLILYSLGTPAKRSA